jgi:LuxR family transcriptional regulator, maltose regulon positive regulatory protein
MGNSFQLLNTKIVIPALPQNVVQRHVLFNKMESDPLAKLILICAPAGYGKSTLANSWFQHARGKSGAAEGVAWYSIELQDNLPALFFSYLIKALQQIDPALGSKAQTFLAYPETPLESLVALLINDLAQSQRRIKIVLDDYQYISDETIHPAINYLVDHLPPQVQLVITSREAPPLALHRMRVYHHLIEIDQHDLRFSLSETVSFLKDFMGLPLSHEVIQSLLQHTEGWVAGLQIAALSIKNRIGQGTSKVIAFPRFFEKNATTRDYFYQEVFIQQPEHLRNFFLKTCVLNQLCGPLCDELVGTQNSAEILEQLQKANSFLTAVNENGEWYRYHSLFSEFLLSRLKKEEIAGLQMQASRWHEQHGMPVEAVGYAFAAGDAGAAGRVLDGVIVGLLKKGEIPLIVGWLERLPCEVILDYGDLATFTIWVLYQRGKGRQADQIMKVFEQKPAGKPLWYMAVSAEILNSKGQIEAALQKIRQALEIEKQAGSSDCSYLNVYGTSLRLAGSYSEALLVFQRALRLAREQKNRIIEALTLFQTANLLYQQGEPDSALLVCKEFAGPRAGESGEPAPLVGYAFIPMGQIYYETDQIEKAARYADEGVRFAREFGMLKPVIQGTLLQARLALLRGDPEEARRLQYDAQGLAADIDHIEFRLMAAAESAELEIRLGNLPAARQHLEFPQVVLYAPHDPLFEQFDLAWARLLIAQDNAQMALKILDLLEARALFHKHCGTLVRIQVLQARAFYRQGLFAAALGCLEKAVRLAAPIQYLRSFLDQEADLAALLPAIQPVQPEFVACLLNKLNPMASPCPALLSSDLFTHFSKRECEIIRLVMEDCPNKEIAQRLFISVGTTKWHLNGIFKKMGVKNREEIIALVNRLQSGAPADLVQST